MTEEERRRIVAAGFEKFKKLADADVPTDDNPFNELIGKLICMQDTVKRQVKPVLEAGGGREPRNLERLIADCYAVETRKFSKGELEEIVAWMLTSNAMEGLYPSKMGVKPSL